MKIRQKAGASISVPSNVTSSSDTANDSSSDSTFIIPIVKQVRRQTFCQAWLKDPYFKAWLQQADDPYKAKCAVCSIFLRAKKSILHQHVYTETHMMKIQQKAGASISVPSNVASSSSDTTNDSSSDSTFIIPTVKQVRRQTFCQAWLEDPYFKPWLQQADDPYKAKCAVCSIFLRAQKSILHEHVYTETHIMKIRQKAGASISVPSNVASSSSDTANDSSSDSTFIIPAAKQVWRQTFCQAWLEDPDFKPWLQQADDPYKAKCAVCSIFLRAKKSILHQHVYTETHMMKIREKAGASISVPSNVASSSSDTANDSSSAGNFTCPPAKKPKTAKTLNIKQSFRQAWLEDPYFKPWLQQADDPYKAKCAVCSIFLRSKKSILHQHAHNEIHMMKIRQKAISSSNAENDSSADVSIAGPSSAACIISGGNNDSSSASTFIDPAAKKVIRQTFHQVWLVDPHLKSCLQQQADDPHKAKCTVSSKYVKADKSHLQNHANSEAHNMNMIRDNVRWMKYLLRIQQAKRQVLVRAEMGKHRLLRVAFILYSMIIDMQKYRGRCGKRSLCRKSKYKR